MPDTGRSKLPARRPGQTRRSAQMEVERARRRRVALAMATAVVVVVVVGIAAVMARRGSGTSPTAVPGKATVAPGAPGPEGAPVPAGPSLAPLSASVTGQRINGISCNTTEQLVYHIHVHLDLFVNGVAAQVPAGIGIPSPKFQQSPDGPFVGGGKCFYWLHTHAADGIIHIESPRQQHYLLDDFFAIWGQPLNTTTLGPHSGRITSFVNGRPFRGDPGTIVLTANRVIQIDFGTPVVGPQPFTFPPGL